MKTLTSQVQCSSLWSSHGLLCCAEDHWDLDKHLKFVSMTDLPFDQASTEIEAVKDAVLWNRFATAPEADANDNQSVSALLVDSICHATADVAAISFSN